MKKEESLMGIFSLIIGFVSIFTIMHDIGFMLAIVSLVLAIPSVLQKKKGKIGGILGLILSLIVLFVWLVLPHLLVFLLR